MIKDWTHANRHVSSTVESFRSQSISCRGAIYNSFQLPDLAASRKTSLPPRFSRECARNVQSCRTRHSGNYKNYRYRYAAIKAGLIR